MDIEDMGSTYGEGYEEAIEDVEKLVDEDIAIQKSQLENDFEKDKSRNWRVIGMESLKEKIRRPSHKTGDSK